MPLLARGYDASWDPPDPACMKNAGYSFACRYSSADPSKNLSGSELGKLMSLGMSVCVVHQDGKDQMARGYSGGQADARSADAFVKSLGIGGIPLYFSCDKDFEACTSSQKSAVDAYCDGVTSVIGRARAGGYGDDSFCKRQFDAGRITFGWQTRSWSEGMWEPRAQLRQVKFDFAYCGGTIDDDEAWASDYGQWPRPAGTRPEEDEGMFAVMIPPGTGVDTADPSNDIGVSLDKTSYTKVGFCCDPGRLGDAPVKIRVAWHRTDGYGWGVAEGQMTAANPKLVITMTAKCDGVSFRRQDAVPIDLYPNFA